jgi:DNA-binding HxlR family transcriptional regulator
MPARALDAGAFPSIGPTVEDSGQTHAGSPLAQALASVGDRWTLLVVAALLDGPRRFNDLLEQIAGIAPNILSQRLRHLEQLALVVAQPYSKRPPRSLYELTEPGRGLAGALRHLSDWGARQAGGGEPLRHGACGTPMEAVWYCPACERPVGEDEADLHFI